MNDYESAVE